MSSAVLKDPPVSQLKQPTVFTNSGSSALVGMGSPAEGSKKADSSFLVNYQSHKTIQDNIPTLGAGPAGI